MCALQKNRLTCKIQAQCLSCAYVNQPYQLMLEKKHLDGVKLIKEQIDLNNIRVLEPKEAKPNLGYRTVAKLAVRPHIEKKTGFQSKNVNSRQERFSIGLFEPNSHNVVNMQNCPIHTRVIEKCLADLRTQLEDSELNPWDEKKSQGDLRYIIMRSSHRGSDLMLVFVVSHKSCFLKLRDLVKKMQKKQNITSSFMSVHEGDGNKIWGTGTKKISGTDRLRLSLCDLSLHLSPSSFFQVNPFMAEKIYHRIEQFIGTPPSDKICAWDLYCGIGHIGLVMARSGYKVLGLEENSGSIEDANHNARVNKLEDKAKFVATKVEDFLASSESSLPNWAKSPQIIVVNPSRKGLAQSVCDFFIEMKNIQSTHKIIYISCNVETFARDLKKLVEGGYRLSQIESFDMFAQTDKLEWLAVLN